MIEIKNLSHTYSNREEGALKDINLTINKGESIVIVGSSGSGKSTLLQCINRLIEPSSGSILVNGENILNGSKKTSEALRGKIGMVFQNYNLIGRDTVLRNTLDGRIRYNNTFKVFLGRFSKKDYEIVENNLKKVSLYDLKDEITNNLSGGQKQRVGIARALSQNPEIILADEPVSSLDPMLMEEIMDLLKKVCEEEEITLITSLHFLKFAKVYGTRIIGLRKGEVVFDGKPEELTKKNIIDIYGEFTNGRNIGF